MTHSKDKRDKRCLIIPFKKYVSFLIFHLRNGKFHTDKNNKSTLQKKSNVMQLRNLRLKRVCNDKTARCHEAADEAAKRVSASHEGKRKQVEKKN